MNHTKSCGAIHKSMLKKESPIFSNLHIILFLTPALILGVLLIIYPLIATIFYSFTNINSNTVNYNPELVEKTILEQTLLKDFSQQLLSIELDFKTSVTQINTHQSVSQIKAMVNTLEKTKRETIDLALQQYSVYNTFTKQEIKNIKSEIKKNQPGLSGNQIDQLLHQAASERAIKLMQQKIKNISYQISMTDRPLSIYDSYSERLNTFKISDIEKISLSMMDKCEKNIQQIDNVLVSEKEKEGVKFIGLSNFQQIMLQPFSKNNQLNRDKSWFQMIYSSEFIRVIFQTIIWTTVCVFFQFIIGFYLAILLNKKVKGNLIYRTLLMIPWTVPQFVAAIAWRFLYWKEKGLINEVLRRFTGGEINFLGDSNLLLPSSIIVNIWIGIPFMMITILGALQSIDENLYEAAQIDGANRWQELLHVTVPGVRKVASVAVLLAVIWTFNAFSIIYLVTLGNKSIAKDILVTYAFERFNLGDYNLASAYALKFFPISSF